MLKSDEPPEARLIASEEVVARALLEVGVGVVAAYPGPPTQGIVEHLARLQWSADLELRWTSSPRLAVELAHGASLAGRKSVACLNAAGMGEAYSSLVAASRTGCGAGFLLMAGDDPGAWDSMAELDSRPLLSAAGLPIFEPSHVAEVGTMVAEAYRMARLYDLPVAVRLCTALMEERVPASETRPFPAAPPGSARAPRRGVRLALPLAATVHEQRLQAKLEHISHASKFSRFAEALGSGSKGIVAVGFAYSKLKSLLGRGTLDNLRILKLGMVFPLPAYALLEFLLQLEEVLILEEGEPYVETEVRALLAESVAKPRIHGKLSGAISLEGELQRWEVEEALRRLLPGLELAREAFPLAERTRRPLLSTMCPGCPLETLHAAVKALGQREPTALRPIVVGDHGCLSSLASKKDRVVEVLAAPGSAIGLGLGYALAQRERQVLVLTGDYGLLGRGVEELAVPAYRELPLTVVIVDNGGAASWGGPRRPSAEGLRFEELPKALNLPVFRVLDNPTREDVEQCVADCLGYGKLALVLVRFPCLVLEEVGFEQS